MTGRAGRSPGSAGAASSSAARDEVSRLRQMNSDEWERQFDDRFPADRPGLAVSYGVQVDTMDYGDLRVPGLKHENTRRRGPHLELRGDLLAQIAQDVASREQQRCGRPSDAAHAAMPRPARRARSVGVSADRRDFNEFREDALKRECRARGLSIQGLRHVLLRRVEDDVELRAREGSNET